MLCTYVSLIHLAPGPSNGDVRLSNFFDSTNMTGRLEVFYEGRWGTVCDDLFDNNGAMVVCRQLGFNPVGAVAVLRAGFGQGADPIWLDNVDCRGTEENIDSCPHNAWGVHNCGHFEDAGVVCICKLLVFASIFYLSHITTFNSFNNLPIPVLLN